LTGNKDYRLARRMGFSLGLAISIALIAAWQVPAGSGRLGLDVRVVANQTGELHVAPVGAFVTGTGLEAGGPDTARGQTEVTNQTGRTLDVRMRLLPNTRDVDGVLVVDARGGGRRLYSGPLGGARRWSREAVRVAPGDTFEVDLRLHLPEGVSEHYRGRMADITLELSSAVAGDERAG
jgi:hypothetical protein